MLTKIDERYIGPRNTEINFIFAKAYLENGIKISLFDEEFFIDLLTVQWQYMVQQITRNEMYANKNPKAKF